MTSPESSSSQFGGQFNPDIPQEMQGNTLVEERPIEAAEDAANSAVTDTLNDTTVETEDVNAYNVSDEQYTSIAESEGKTLSQARREFLQSEAAQELQARGMGQAQAERLAKPMSVISEAVRSHATGEELSDKQLKSVNRAERQLKNTMSGIINSRASFQDTNENGKKVGKREYDDPMDAEEVNTLITSVGDVMRGTNGRQNIEASASLKAHVAEHNAKREAASTEDATSAETANNDTAESETTAKASADSANNEEPQEPAFKVTDKRNRDEDSKPKPGAPLNQKVTGAYNLTSEQLGARSREFVGAKVTAERNDVNGTPKNFKFEYVSPNLKNEPVQKGMELELHAEESGKNNDDVKTGSVADKAASTAIEKRRAELMKQPEIAHISTEFEMARLEYAKLSAMRRRVTLGGHAKELDAARENYIKLRNEAGVAVAVQMIKEGATPDEIKAFACLGAVQEAQTLTQELVAAQQNMATNNRLKTRFMKFWANNTSEYDPNKSRIRNVVTLGNVKKGAAVAVISSVAVAPAVVAAGAVFGVGAGVGAGVAAARSISRSIIRGRIDRAAKAYAAAGKNVGTDIELAANAAPADKDANWNVSKWSIDDPKGKQNYQDFKTSFVAGMTENGTLTTEDITKVVETDTAREVTGNRRRAAIAAGIGAIVGTAGASLGRSLDLDAKLVSGASRLNNAIRGNGGGARPNQASVLPFGSGDDIRNGNLGRAAAAANTAPVVPSAADQLRGFLESQAAQGGDATKLQSVAEQLRAGATEINIPVVPGAGMVEQIHNGLGLSTSDSEKAVQWLLDNKFINVDGSGGIAGVKGTTLADTINYSTGAGDGSYHLPRTAVEGMLKNFVQSN